MKIMGFVILLFSLSSMSCAIVLEDISSQQLNELILEYSVSDNYSLLNTLIDQGADLLATDEQRRTVLHLAALKNPRPLRIVYLFLMKGSQANIPRNTQINAQDDRGDTPLHVAVRRGEFDLIYLLYSNGSDISIENKQGQKPIDLAGPNIATVISSFLSPS